MVGDQILTTAPCNCRFFLFVLVQRVLFSQLKDCLQVFGPTRSPEGLLASSVSANHTENVDVSEPK